MIQAALEFPLSAKDLVTKTILSLPEMLRPTTVNLARTKPPFRSATLMSSFKLSKCHRSVSIFKTRLFCTIFVDHPPALGLLTRI